MKDCLSEELKIKLKRKAIYHHNKLIAFRQI
jgi:hypothetical protein